MRIGVVRAPTCHHAESIASDLPGDLAIVLIRGHADLRGDHRRIGARGGSGGEGGCGGGEGGESGEGGCGGGHDDARNHPFGPFWDRTAIFCVMGMFRLAPQCQTSARSR